MGKWENGSDANKVHFYLKQILISFVHYAKTKENNDFKLFQNILKIPLLESHQWQSGSVLKTGKRETPFHKSLKKIHQLKEKIIKLKI